MSRRVIVIGMACVCLSLSGAAVSAVENHGTSLGQKYLKEGDYARAERIFEQVLNQDPKDMKAWEGYRAAFQKRKQQEDGTATTEEPPPPGGSSASSSSGDEAPAPRKPRKKKPAASSDDDSGPSSGGTGDDSGEAPTRKDVGKIDATMLHKKSRAKERFDKLRDELSQNYKRQHSGAVEIHATFYDQNLYKMLIENLGAQKGYSADKAQKLYEASVRDMRNQLEFYLKLTNYSQKPKLSVSLADLHKKITLVDDEGNSYEVARWKGPKGGELLEDDAITVWFNKTDSDGDDIVKKAGKGNLYITLTDLQHEQKSITLPFKAARISGEAAGKAAGGKSIMDRVKDMWK